MSDLVLQHGLSFADLYSREGLVRLDAAFMAHLQGADASLFALLVGGRAAPEKLAAKDESDLIVDVAPHLEDFIAALFGIQAEVLAHQSQHDALSPLYTVKRLFVQRRAAKGATPDAIAKLDGAALAAKLEALMGEQLTERSFATHVAHWLNNEAQYAGQLDYRRAIRRLGDAFGRGQEALARRHPVQDAASPRHASPRAGQDHRA